MFLVKVRGIVSFRFKSWGVGNVERCLYKNQIQIDEGSCFDNCRGFQPVFDAYRAFHGHIKGRLSILC